MMITLTALMRILTGGAAALLLMASLNTPSQADMVHRFDFGPATGGVADGFTPVSSKDDYSEQRGYGLIGRAHLDDDMNNVPQRRHIITLDPLSADRVINPGQFRVDLPDGDYELAIFTGSYTTVYVSNRLHNALINEHTIRHGDKVLYHRPAWSINDYFAPDGPYFASYHTFYEPGMDLWETYMARHFPVIHASVTVTDGHLLLDYSPDFSLNGLMIWSADAAQAGQTALAEVQAMRRNFFNAHYVQQPRLTDQPALDPTPAQREAGLVPFGQAVMTWTYPEFVPYRHQTEQPAGALAAQGERALWQVGFLPLRDAGEVWPEVSDLSGPDVIPAQQVQVRYARYEQFVEQDRKHYTIRPRLLVEHTRVPGSQGVARAYFLSLSVPEDAKPGIYQGAVRFYSTNGLTGELPLQLRVLPFSLPRPDVAVGPYYSYPSGTRYRAWQFQDARNPELVNIVDRQIQADFALMRTMGMNYVSAMPRWRPFHVDEQGNITPNDDVYDAFVRLNDLIRDAGFTSFSNFGIGWTVLMNHVPNFLTRQQAEGLTPEQVVFPESAVVPGAAAVKHLYDLRRERNWPTMHFYVSDELGNMGAIGAVYGRELTRYFERLRPYVGEDYLTMSSEMRFPTVRTMLGQVDHISPNLAFPFNQRTVEAVRESGSGLWTYNMSDNRLSFGYYLWKIGAKGRQQWIHEWNATRPDPFFGLATHPTLFDCSIDPDLNGVPALGWYVVAAEGIKDYRYLQLLTQRMDKQPDHPAVRFAREVLAELNQRVDMEYLSASNNWQAGTYEYFRWRIAQAIMAFDADN